MPISLASVRRAEPPKPPRVMAMGVAGVGKTSLASAFPSPIVLQTEDGLGMLDVPTFGMLRSYGEVIEAIGSLYDESHDFKTIIVDSADHLEPLVWAETCRLNGWKNLEQPGFGKGYVAALDVWRQLLDGVNALRNERDMAVFIIAHSAVQRFDNPETEPYDRYVPKLHKGASALLQESMDCVFFCNYQTVTVKAEAGFNKKIVRGIGRGERVLYTEERPAFLAKQRYNLPPTITMDPDPRVTFDHIAAGIPYYASQISNAQ